MKILFMTIGEFSNIRQHEIYPDLIRYFKKQGHEIFVVASHEKRDNMPTQLTTEDGVQILRVRIGNITGSGLLEKGIATLMIESQYWRGIKKYYANVSFDLILYHTPPITLGNIVHKIKKKYNAVSYLMLKDIFPQNAVDLGMMQTTGLKRVLYAFFRKKETQIYKHSDYIGCMSEANRQYLLKRNPWLDAGKVELCPNCIEINDITPTDTDAVRNEYGIPLDKTVLVYGGNLGKPQGIHFLIECLQSQKNNKDVFFLVIGGGTEYRSLEQHLHITQQKNVKLMKHLPTQVYNQLVSACDVGMVFLDHRFTIPNFPSRILPYMESGLPVLAVTDPVSDIGQVICEGGFGWWCESNDLGGFSDALKDILSSDLKAYGKLAAAYLQEHYDVSVAYNAIMSHF